MNLFLTASQSSTTMTLIGTIALYAVLFGGIYFFLFRPQRKRENEIKVAQSKLATGDEVLLTGGVFGKIIDVGEDVFIVEIGLNKGVRIPVKKDSAFPSNGYKL